ncbi:MAG: prolipoprotein diacylglyceryl transferase [Bacteroidales bacterium]|jgi:prolipoprotein diacylglyceryl transferase|nr:prolipoprotein diacylglyceryl transferase [Bacteroidales bacterium]
MSLLYIIWDVNPVMFSIGDFSIRWYGLFLALGFLFSYFILGHIMRKEGFKQERVDILSIYVIVGTVIGLRLGHVLFYNPSYYFSNPVEILKVWEGGLASHGGAAGILLAVWLFSRKYKISYLGLLDKIVVVVPLAGGMVRLGNLMNSEIVGIPTDVPWAFIFKRLGDVPLHPTQLYEAIFYFIMFGVFFFIYNKFHSKWKDGTFLGWFLVVLFGFRFIIEYTKMDQVEFDGWTSVIRMGQLLSIPFILLGFFFIARGYGWFNKRVNKNEELKIKN